MSGSEYEMWMSRYNTAHHDRDYLAVLSKSIGNLGLLDRWLS
jgi:hypothetical protein